MGKRLPKVCPTILTQTQMRRLASVMDRAQLEKHKMVQVDFLIANPISSIQADKNAGLATKASLSSQVPAACSRDHA